MTDKTTPEEFDGIPPLIKEEVDEHLAEFIGDDEDPLYDKELIDTITYLLEKRAILYPNKIDEETFYSPYRHAFSHRYTKQDEFTVHYAFPNGSNSPVATFWAHYRNSEGNERPRCVNVDLSRLVDFIIEYYKHNGYFAKEYVQKY